MKILFTLMIAFLLLAVENSAFAGNLVAQNATLNVTGPDTVTLEATVTIVNNGANSMYVRVARKAKNLMPHHTTQFCWTLCYSSSTSISPDSILLNPGGSTSVFIGYVKPWGFEGNSSVTYCFFDSNPADSLYLTFNYTFLSTVGINEIPTRPVITNAYPNPADGVTSIVYNLNATKEAKLVIYNLLGSVVKEMKLTEKQNTVFISTTDLKSGIYFYSLVADGKAVSTRKLIVAHR